MGPGESSFPKHRLGYPQSYFVLSKSEFQGDTDDHEALLGNEKRFQEGTDSCEMLPQIREGPGLHPANETVESTAVGQTCSLNSESDSTVVEIMEDRQYGNKPGSGSDSSG